MAKYGSPSAKLLLVGGFDLRGVTTEISQIAKDAPVEETTPLGDDWRANAATGVRTAAFSQNGFYDDATGSINEAMVGNQGISRVGVVGIAGNSAGASFVGFEGTFAGVYRRIATRGALHKANVDYSVSGQLDEGIVLQPLEQKSADWNTEGALSQDAGASSANGGAGYLQVTEFTGLTGFVAKVRHSADDVTYADLVTFTNVTNDPAAERVAVAGTINRHLAANGDVTGTGTVTAMIGFARG